ncbi:unnamed protein product [Rhizophagus irregularis]|nr:unnamed protein product [Rhizophagus irregularis]
MIMDYFHYLMIIIIINSLSVFCQEQSQREYRELITEQIIFLPKYYQVFNHTDLPVVKNELSITLKINIIKHEYNSYYHTIFYKGNTSDNQTPSLWLRATEPVPLVRCSTTSNIRTGFELDDYEFRITQCNDGFFGLISNFRYYNFRLSHEEVLKDYSGEDPTIINDDDSGTTSNFILVIVSYFLDFLEKKIITKRGSSV